MGQLDLLSGDDGSPVDTGGKVERMGRYMELGRFVGQSLWKLT